MRILMLGNSLSTAHGLPGRLGELLDAEVTVHARGGARLAEQLNPATHMGALTSAAFDAGGWDYVVMQEVSNAAVKAPGRMVESVSSLSARAREVGARPILYGTWAYAPWCLKLELLGCTSFGISVIYQNNIFFCRKILTESVFLKYYSCIDPVIFIVSKQ